MTADEILAADAHRPFPFSSRRWIMRQQWHDLLFAHWAFPPEDIRKLVPPQLELDLWDSRAYVGVVPFEIRNLRPRGTPPIPVFSNFAEINVRTYVTFDGKPGVYFWSLDAANMSAVLGARLGYALPYYLARFAIELRGESIVYRSRRQSRQKPAEFLASYRPISDVLPWNGLDQRLERFLTERYCLYAVVAGHVYRTDIHHVPWPLQMASAEIEWNTMTAPLGLNLPGSKPLLHFSRFQDVLVWWPVRVR